jgi:hypothetical protein
MLPCTHSLLDPSCLLLCGAVPRLFLIECCYVLIRYLTELPVLCCAHAAGGGNADQTYRIVFYNVDSAWNTNPIQVAAPAPVGTLSATDFVITPVATALEAYTAASLPALKSQYDDTITLGVESQPANPGVAATPALSSYDVTYSTTCINALCTLARLKFNGETVGLVNLDLADTMAYTTVGVSFLFCFPSCSS